ncbi:hypothetical protein EC988_010337, partial [Linderina pennispora]
SDTDAFSVPWRTEEREIAELREELREAQQAAKAFDARQASVSEPFEAVFDTARRLAEERSVPSLKGKEPEVGSGEEPADRDAGSKDVYVNEQAVVAAGYEDGEDLEDIDYVPDDETDEEEEELLQDIEPIDEAEE